MNTYSIFRLNRQSWFVALISAAYSTAPLAAAGKVEFSLGTVSALGSDGRSRTLTKGAEINSGDTIQTVDGRAQVRFSDGGYISLQPNTEFKVEDYAFSGKADGSEKGFFSLVKGGLRAITGAIGHGTNKSAYRVSTSVATIGIRGTEYTASQNGDALLVRVGDGAVFLENDAGNLMLYQGQSGEVSGGGNSPQHSDESPNVGSAGPNNTQAAQEDEKKNQQQQQIFTAGDLKSSDGGICGADGASGGGCGILPDADVRSGFDMANEINALAVNGTVGNYYGSGTVGAYSVDVDYTIYFSSHQAYLSSFSIDGPGGQLSASSCGSGSLNSSTGAFALPYYVSYTSGCSSGGCSLNSLSGQLSSVSGLTDAVVHFSASMSGTSVSGSVNTSMGSPD
ncbi:MAG: FecR domain-containing protein [Methylophilaceae bacterium]